MTVFTSKERLSLLFAIGLTISLILTYTFFSGTNQGVLYISWGLISIIFSGIITYSFVYQSKSFSDPGSDSSYYTGRRGSFHPNVIPPSKLRKKTQIEGKCSRCGSVALLGFTCSYCGGYYCNIHRLPEKHDCVGLFKR